MLPSFSANSHLLHLPHSSTQVNLRDQAHAKVKEQNLYTPANVKGGHLTWPQAQETRVAAMSALNTLPATATTAERRAALRNAALISLMTLIPPDRVGVIRRLRLKHTLQRREGGGWRLNLNLRKDGHKTSKHYGPFCAKLPAALDDILDRYAAFLAMEPEGDSAYLFGPRGKIDRPLEMSGYSQACKRAFQLHSPGGQEISPKSLRSSFIVWLRDNTSAPEILRAAAHAQKHSERRQASDSYDTERDTRLVQAAYDFNLAFVTANYAVPVSAAAAPSSPSVLSQVKCNYPECFAMATESLMVCSYSAGCSKLFHKSCALAAGCPGSALCCQFCLPSVGQAGGSAAAGDGAAAESDDDGDEEDEEEHGLADDEPWVVIPGPFAIRRQPYRAQIRGPSTQWAYACKMTVDPFDTPFMPGGKLKFLCPGAPKAGIILDIPHIEATDTSLTFRMRLDKATATQLEIIVPSLLYRNPPPLSSDDEYEDDTPLALRPANAQSAQQLGQRLLANLAAAEQEPGEEQAVGEEVVQEEAAVEDGGASEEPPSLPMPEGVDAAEWTSWWEAGGLAAAGFDAETWDSQPSMRLVYAKAMNDKLTGAFHVGLDAFHETALLALDGGHFLVEMQRLLAKLAEQPVAAAEEAEVGDPPTPPTPPEAAADVLPTPRPTRQRKRKGHFGDNGELDGAASSFRSAQSARKASVDPSVEMGIPAFAKQGTQVWATGLHAGVRKRFKATVIGVRKQFPRIVVKYFATEDDVTNRIALPEMLTAYLTMVDVEPKDW